VNSFGSRHRPARKLPVVNVSNGSIAGSRNPPSATVFVELFDSPRITNLAKVDTGTCNACARPFRYSLLHSGFADSAYAYCDKCGMTAFVSAWNKAIPLAAKLKAQGPNKSRNGNIVSALRMRRHSSR
jgi:hypothetical protein